MPAWQDLIFWLGKQAEINPPPLPHRPNLTLHPNQTFPDVQKQVVNFFSPKMIFTNSVGSWIQQEARFPAVSLRDI